MHIEFKYEADNIDWAEAADLFRRAPLGTRDPEKLRRACQNSYAVCFAFESEKLIGMGRAISDGEYQAAIYDVVLLPEYQGKGFGSRIMRNLYERLPVETVILYAAPGKESFYKKLGYSRMLTAMARRAKDTEGFRLKGYIE